MSKICKHCSEPFKPSRRNSEYCSKSCQNRAYYDRRVTKDPLYANAVSEKRKVSIRLEKEAEVARRQRIIEKRKIEAETERLKAEELQRIFLEAEQERKDLEMHNSRLKEEALEERQRQLEKQRVELKAHRERKEKERKEQALKNIETLARVFGSLFEK